ncbi:TonB-dependent receptor [Glaciecola sp. 2405UD65-10]|uniref:TonB-dependent receptor n=1 Tax=Glaciecola sp. 2405UD65-10 TaxID=3397244 RepID=UPI003B5A5997
MNTHYVSLHRPLIACAVYTALSNYTYATTNEINESAASGSIESIEVIGQINTLAIESDIELSQTSSPDLRKQLLQFPSLSVNGNGRVTGIVQYRGMFSDRVKLSIDGTHIAGAGPNAMDSPLSHVIGTLSQQVTLYQGIAPVSAGAETIGGALDISEQKPNFSSNDNYDFSGALTLGWFNNKSNSASGTINAVNKSSYLSLSGDTQSGDNVQAGSGITVPNTFYDRHGAKVRMGYRNQSHQIDWYLSSRTTGASGTPTLAMDIDFIDALVSGLDYKYFIDNQWTFKAKLSANNNEHEMNNFALRPNSLPTSFRINTVDSEGRGIATSLLYEKGNWANEYGAEYKTKEQNSRITNPNASGFFLQSFANIERSLGSVYGQLSQTYAVNSGWQSWQVGARLSQVSAKANNVDTSMAMMMPPAMALRDAFNNADKSKDFSLADVVAKTNYMVNNNIQLQASVGIKENAPSYSQLYVWFPLGVSAGLADGRNYLGNLDLQKESAKKIDFSAHILGDNWSFSPSVFYSHIDDYIIGLPSTNMPANMIAAMNGIANPLVWGNDEALIKGLDVTYSHQVNQYLSMRMNAQYVRGKQTGAIQQDLYRIAPLSANLSIAYTQNNYQVNLHSYIVSKQDDVSASQNETSTAGYALFDLSVAYYFNNGFTLNVLAENILDKTYADHLSGLSRVSNIELPAGSKQLGAGRNIGAYLTYQF